MTPERMHVQDTLATSISATVEEQGNSITISTEDMNDLLKVIGDKNHINRRLKFRDIPYEVRCNISHSSNSRLVVKHDEERLSDNFWLNFPEIYSASKSVRFDLFFVHVPTGNASKATYSLYNQSNGEWRLAYIGNPTTLINGHNSSPVRLFNKPGFKENMLLHRLGFDFLFEVLQFSPSDAIVENLKFGLIALQNSQFAVYAPCAGDKGKYLRELKLLYSRPAGEAKLAGKMMAEFLGLKATTSSEEDKTGLILRSVYDNNSLFTVNFYDKALSNKLKKKKGIDPATQTVLDNSLRIDITLHRRFIDQLAARAKTMVQARIQHTGRTNIYYKRFIEQMNQGKTSSALVMCMIIHFLPKKHNDTFASFLIREIVCKHLYLDKLINVEEDRLILKQENANPLVWEIYCCWKTCETIEDWKKAKKALIESKPKNSVYRAIDNLENLLGVSTDIPYLFWLESCSLDAIYGLSRQEKELLLQSNDIKTNDESERIKAAGRVDTLIRKGRASAKQHRKVLSDAFLKPLGLDNHSRNEGNLNEHN